MTNLVKKNFFLIIFIFFLSFLLNFIFLLPFSSLYINGNFGIERTVLSLYDFNSINLDIKENGYVKNHTDPQLYYNLKKKIRICNILFVLKDISNDEIKLQAYYKNEDHDYSEDYSSSKYISNCDCVSNISLDDYVDSVRIDIGTKNEQLRIKKIILNPNLKDYLVHYLRYPNLIDILKLSILFYLVIVIYFRKKFLGEYFLNYMLGIIKKRKILSQKFFYIIRLYEYIFLMFFFFFLLVYYINIGSMIDVKWTNNIGMIILTVAKLFAGIAFFRMLYDKKKCSLILSILFLATINISHYFSYNDHYILVTSYIVVACYSIKYSSILKCFIFSVGGLVLLDVLLSIFRIIPDLIYWHNGQLSRHSFGANYPTDFAAAILYLLMALWFLLKKREIILLFVLPVFIYIQLNFTFTRNSIICSFFLLIFIFFYLIKFKFASFNFIYFTEKYIIKYLSLASFTLLALLSIYISYAFNSNDDFFVRLNELFSDRFNITHQSILDNGISLFGKHIVLVGLGSSIDPPSGYNFLDISYCNILLRYGVVSLIIITLCNFYLIFRAIKYNLNKLFYILLIISIHCFVEHHYLEGCYNIFIFLTFAKYSLCLKQK